MRRLLWNQVSFALSGLVIQVLISYGVDGYELGKLSGARDFVKPFLKNIENVDLFGSQLSSSYKKFGEGFLKTLTDNADDLLNSFGKLEDQTEDTISGFERFIDISENELNINAPNLELKIKRDEKDGSKVKSVVDDSAIRESETADNEITINEAPTSEELFTDLESPEELQKEVQPKDSQSSANATEAKESINVGSSASNLTDGTESKQVSSSTDEKKGKQQVSSKADPVVGGKNSSKADDYERKGGGLFSILNNLKLMLSVPIKIESTRHTRPREKNAPRNENICCECEPFT